MPKVGYSFSKSGSLSSFLFWRLQSHKAHQHSEGLLLQPNMIRDSHGDPGPSCLF